jgi:hypothetical protein
MDYLPEHKICSKNIKRPTLITDDTGAICVQWFGVSDSTTLPKNSQFLFPLLNDFVFDNFIDGFKIIFIDQAKNWIKPSAVQAIIDGPGQGNPNVWLLWAMNHHVQEEVSNGKIQCLSPIVQIIELGDPNCGSTRSFHIHKSLEILDSHWQCPPHYCQ